MYRTRFKRDGRRNWKGQSSLFVAVISHFAKCENAHHCQCSCDIPRPLLCNQMVQAIDAAGEHRHVRVVGRERGEFVRQPLRWSGSGNLQPACFSGFISEAKTAARMKALLLFPAVVLGAHVGALAAQSVDYLREIKPLLKARCYSCHGALKQKAELRLDTGEAIRRGGKHGPVVLTNEVAKSPLLLRVTSTDPDERMPAEGNALTPEQIARLRNWIGQGAAFPANEKPEADPREHWAFKPPTRPPAPPIRHPPSVIRNPIDAFIFAELEKRGLVSSPEAGKEVLLRRVYLDLIGLPPTLQELHDFLATRSPDAYEQVVNRLLSSPQHAERWARHWMDIWRYADWYGRRHVPDVWNSAPQVWRWRDG